MLGHEHGIESLDQSRQPCEVAGVQCVRSAQGQPYTVQRERIVAPQPFERCDRRPAAEVVLRVDLQESGGRAGGQDLGDMRRA